LTDRCRAAFSSLFGLFLLLSPAAILTPSPARAQTQSEIPWYARTNTFGVTFAYSPDSSHILLGVAEQRRILEIGVSYNRKLVMNRFLNWQYSAELLPVALESDPLTRVVETQITPTPATTVYNNEPPITTCAPITAPYTVYLANGSVYATGTETITCQGRRWTIGQAMSPVGFQWNFLPRRRLQPMLEGHGGYLYSTQPIPVTYAGSFNFTFDIGLGFELYRSSRRSIRAEYRYHHISNSNTAPYNPGIDNGVIQVSYTFGR
jgi:hypothetical protein